jgi:hypothetical protein
MELRDHPPTPGPGDHPIVDMSTDHPAWLYGEGDLRVLGKTAPELYEAIDVDGKYKVEQVSHASAAQEPLLTLL